MRRVLQRLKRDCFFCSVAMASGTPYDRLGDRVGWKIMSRVGDGGSQDDGTINADWVNILRAGGFELGENIHRVWTAPGYVGTGILRSMLWGRRAIIDCWLGPNDGHAVYWDGEKLHDPLPKPMYPTLNHIQHMSNIFLIKDPKEVKLEVIEPDEVLHEAEVVPFRRGARTIYLPGGHHE